MPVGPDQKLLHYRLVEQIGEGAMGVVWKAVDTSLEREVAIKILPDDFAGDADRLARFEREAKLLASLSHPNIAAVFGLHEDGGVRFLAMELVPGEDMSARLSRRLFPIDEAIDVARQIAEALEAAHEQGVVHRDLKPANIQIDPESAIKVLDFGLAKGFESEPADAELENSPTITSTGTLAGTLLGTAAFMSPEQARGLPADKRADVWAFGCVLYEMLTGRRAFEGETLTDTLATILKNEPDLDALPGTTPSSLRELLRRCLVKDKRRRLRDVGEARILLEDMQQGTAPKIMAADELPPPHERGSRTWLRWGLMFAAVTLAYFVGYQLRSGGDSGWDIIDADLRMRQLTQAAGLEQDPAVSPDGNYLAYTTDEAGNLDIAVMPLAGGEPNMVVDHGADDAQPAWSPDGSQLAFASARERGGLLNIVGGLSWMSPAVQGENADVFLVPALGGLPAKLMSQASYPDWSPDGRSLVVQSDRSGWWDLWTIPAHGGKPVQLTDDESIDYHPAWSPDGRWIVAAEVGPDHRGLFALPVTGGKKIQLTQGDAVASPDWSADGRWIYYASDRNASRASSSVWRLPFPPPTDGSPPRVQRVTLGADVDVDVHASADGKRLAYSKLSNNGNIWELTVADLTMRQVTDASTFEDYPHLASDGRRLAYSSDRGGEDSIWITDLQTGDTQRFTAALDATASLRWSPDGTQLAYVVQSDGRTRLVTRAPGDVSEHEIFAVDAPATIFAPNWSPDGTRIAANTAFGATGRIYTFTLDGTKQQISDDDNLSASPTWSPDARWIAYQRETGGVRRIWVVPSEGGEGRIVSDDAAEYSHPEWHPRDPDKILVLIDHKTLALLSVSSGEINELAGFDQSTIQLDYPSWSHDGSKIYFSLSRRTGDVYLLENL